MSHPIPQEAQCRSHELLCDFSLVTDHPDAHVETCRFCGRKAIWNKVHGRIDNVRYGRAHLRDFLQPFGETRELFIKVYGTDSIERSKEADRRSSIGRAKTEDLKREAMDRYNVLSGRKKTFS